MRKLLLLLVSLIVLILVTACGNSNEQAENVNVLALPWEEVEQLAEDTEVKIFMWGGDEGINSYIDHWVAPRLKETHGIKLVRTPMDIQEVLQKLLTEKEVNQQSGTMDIIWLNGENFKNAKNNQLLWDSFSASLPNFQSFIDESQYEFDFGTKVDGLEAPWGKVQFVLNYNSEKMSEPPTSLTDLKEWVKLNPGKFTYPQADDFTGNAFLRHLFYEFIGEDLLFTEDVDLDEVSAEVWTYLNELKPYLWRNGETYPQTLAQLDQLYSQGEVYMTMGYNEARAESLIENGTFPASTRSFVLDVGSIGNSHFLSIPFNSPNKAGALVAINKLLSPEAQLKKMDSSMWGESSVLDISRLSDEMKNQFETMDRGLSVLTPEELQEAFLAELPTDYVEFIKEKWLIEVVQSK
ncbi:ABC transporter substrate-binding protein [Anaerobacillus isosaccharinicus]|uniref:ABC transporter substrate-binding protein n=1 Tax=Anaerobacillus isosaccharinicus TaxID=1532552 RepID=A0A1S2M346_9BACI|nr:ABC transporter substrate-binding protein [Anaerobacillus isosaccharinicus]MBA5588236.1 ABC transporter substrate-binding protein [Anaerobacillus isosaccharinicus]QOY38318.1 ABC transporter substrate-binding protein [Anaerobacillus isosaccharinicus]